MEIVRHTFLRDNRADLVELLDKNDTRCIHIFSEKYGDDIGYIEDVNELLMNQMAIDFLNDMDIIIIQKPEMKTILTKIIEDLGKLDVDFDPLIVEKFASLYEVESILREVLRCMHYYTSFFMSYDDLL